VPVVFLLVFTCAAVVRATMVPGRLQGIRYPSAGLLVVSALLAVRTYARMGR
jgi:hypothetical protein